MRALGRTEGEGRGDQGKKAPFLCVLCEDIIKFAAFGKEIIKTIIRASVRVGQRQQLSTPWIPILAFQRSHEETSLRSIEHIFSFWDFCEFPASLSNHKRKGCSRAVLPYREARAVAPEPPGPLDAEIQIVHTFRSPQGLLRPPGSPCTFS